MPGKRVIRIAVFSGSGGECLVSTAMAKKGRTPRDSKFVYLTRKQLVRFSQMLNRLVDNGCGSIYAHPACGFVWHR